MHNDDKKIVVGKAQYGGNYVDIQCNDNEKAKKCHIKLIILKWTSMKYKELGYNSNNDTLMTVTPSYT